MKAVVSANARFEHISRETAELMRDFTSVKLPRKQKEGDYNMCKAVMEIKDEGRAEGRAERDTDFVKAIKNLMVNTKKSFDEVCFLMGISEEDKLRYKSLM